MVNDLLNRREANLMRNQKYFLMFTLVGIIVVIFASVTHVFAIGIKTSSSGCKAVNDKLSNSTTLKVEDNGKTIVVGTGFYFDKGDYIILEWSVVDNNAQYIKSTGELVLPNGGSSSTDKTGARSFTFTTTGPTDVSIKLTVADTTNLKSITYKLSCTSAYIGSITSMPGPVVNPFGGYSTLPTLTPLPPLPTLSPLPTRSP
jgi:hypothetical protein